MPARSPRRPARPGCGRSSTSRGSASGRSSRPASRRHSTRCPHPTSCTAGVSPHAPFTVTHADYAMLVGARPPARAAGGDPPARVRPARPSTWTRSPACSAPTPSSCTACSLNDADIALLAELDVPVAHCPRSNALLGCGIAPLTRAPGGRSPGRPRHRLAVLGARLRHVGRDAHGDHARARPHRPGRRAHGRRPRSSSRRCGPRRDRARRRDRLADARARPPT